MLTTEWIQELEQSMKQFTRNVVYFDVYVDSSS
ncbi:MAG: hypothetical protein ACI823_000786, partial [Chitinophagales bacterium]